MITELKPTNLIAVEVPEDSFDFSYDENRNHISSTIEHPISEYFDSGWFSEKLAKGNYKIIGEVTKDKIGFDVEPYVDNFASGLFRDYIIDISPDKNATIFDAATKEESFYSLLAANGLYFENPMEEPVDDENISYHNYLYSKEQWADYENKLVKGKLLIIEKL